MSENLSEYVEANTAKIKKNLDDSTAETLESLPTKLRDSAKIFFDDPNYDSNNFLRIGGICRAVGMESSYGNIRKLILGGLGSYTSGGGVVENLKLSTNPKLRSTASAEKVVLEADASRKAFEDLLQMWINLGETTIAKIGECQTTYSQLSGRIPSEEEIRTIRPISSRTADNLEVVREVLEELPPPEQPTVEIIDSPDGSFAKYKITTTTPPPKPDIYGLIKQKVLSRVEFEEDSQWISEQLQEILEFVGGPPSSAEEDGCQES